MTDMAWDAIFGAANMLAMIMWTGLILLPRWPALHGLWYVATKKEGTEKADTNYPAWIWCKAQAQWLQNLYQDKKLSHDQYIERSALFFPVGHSARKRDADEAFNDFCGDSKLMHW